MKMMIEFERNHLSRTYGSAFHISCVNIFCSGPEIPLMPCRSIRVTVLTGQALKAFVCRSLSWNLSIEANYSAAATHRRASPGGLPHLRLPPGTGMLKSAPQFKCEIPVLLSEDQHVFHSQIKYLVSLC
jgi:hypothetical protein